LIGSASGARRGWGCSFGTEALWRKSARSQLRLRSVGFFATCVAALGRSVRADTDRGGAAPNRLGHSPPFNVHGTLSDGR
jgi:hypothetical protein